MFFLDEAFCTWSLKSIATSRIPAWVIWLGSLQAAAIAVAAGDETEPKSLSRFRRPVAVASADGGRLLLVANETSGSVSVLHVAQRKVLSELDLGGQLSDLAVLPDGKTALATDFARHRVVRLRLATERLRILDDVGVSRYPARVTVSARGDLAFVSCLWSHRVDVLELSSQGQGTVLRTIKLPFAPREHLYLADQHSLLVADAFGGRLAIVDVRTGKLRALHGSAMHNIGGLMLTDGGSQVWIAHQVLNQRTAATQQAVTGGRLMANSVRVLAVEQLLDPNADLAAAARLFPLGRLEAGAADPGCLLFVKDRVVVALRGANAVSISGPGRLDLERVAVGRHPSALAAAPDGQHVFVTNRFSDSVSVVSVDEAKEVAAISLGRMPELRPPQRGRMLFFDGRLSHDGWMSCHSCHSGAHTNGRLADTLGDGSYGAPKQVPSLLGSSLTNPWAWNGSLRELHVQVEKSIETTMHGGPVSGLQLRDLVAFLHSLQPPPQVDAVTPATQKSIFRGRDIFKKQGCGRCHVPPLTYTADATFDVGLSDEAGNRKFNPPSLRGVSQRHRFFHDGRAATLEAVFSEHGHQLTGELTAQQQSDLLTFLRSL